MRQNISAKITAMELALEILKEKITVLKEGQAKEKEEGRAVDKITDTWVEITGGVKDTIGRKAKILHSIGYLTVRLFIVG